MVCVFLGVVSVSKVRSWTFNEMLHFLLVFHLIATFSP